MLSEIPPPNSNRIPDGTDLRRLDCRDLMPTEDVKVGTQRAMFFELSGTELKPAAQGAALPELQNPVDHGAGS